MEDGICGTQIRREME